MKERWAELKTRLATKLAAVSEEVRTYPSPIARCDDQLPGLLDRRAALQRLVRRANDQAVDRLSAAQLAALIEEFTREADGG